MDVKGAISLIVSNLAEYLTGRFTGKITFTFNCKDGGIGSLSMKIEKDFSKKDLTPSENDAIFESKR